MKAHELAKLLLQGPNLEVVIENECADDGLTLCEVFDIKLRSKTEAHHYQYPWDSAWGNLVIELTK